MNEPLETSLRGLVTRTLDLWPAMAEDLLRVPGIQDLGVKDLAVLLMLAPGEHVARPAIEACLGKEGADTAVGTLEGRGFLVEEPAGIRLANKGRALIDGLVAMRATMGARILGTLSDQQRAEVTRCMEMIVDAARRSESLVGA